MPKKDTSDSPQLLGEISQAPNGFEQFLERNQKSLLVLAILGALGGAGWVVYNSIEKSKANDAGAALVKADDLPALQSVTKDFPDTPAAGSAIVLAADKQWADGQQDAAIETLNGFIKSKPDHPAIPSAQASLGTKLMAQGKMTEASAAFQSVIDNKAGRFLAPYALIQLGDIAKLGGEIDKARGFYERVQSEFPGNEFIQVALHDISVLNAKPPVEIADTKKPAPTEGPDSGTDLKSLQGGTPFGGLVDPGPLEQPAPTIPHPPVQPPTPPAAPPQPATPPAQPPVPPAEPALPAK